MEETSAFFSTPAVPDRESLSTLTLIHQSAGGMCDLFRIDRMGRFRVLKCLKPAYRGDALGEGLLRKEFEIGYSLSHRFICQYYAFEQQQGLGNCIEMEWVDGRSLGQALEDGSVSKADRERILDEICEALSYLHSKQILHRDLTPANIMLTYAGNSVKLIDFGFSDSDGFSMLKTPAGTRNYTAPEVLSGQKADIRSEIYSLGLLIGLVSGGRHRAVVRKCCADDPSQRYATVAEVREALKRRRGVLPAVLGGVLVAGLLAGALLLRTGRQTVVPEDVPVSHKDTIVLVQPVVPAEVPAAKPVRPVQPAAQPAEKPESPSVNPQVVDEIFRQATELFD